jgi:Icc-related predicted phosphoesterase
MRIVAVSDVHTRFARIEVPDGDVFVVAGDLCEMEELEQADAWLRRLPHRTKLYVPGNHDLGLVYDSSLIQSATVLIDELVCINGLRFYGIPAPSRGREVPKAPESFVDVLITHEPPHLIRDWNEEGANFGSEAVLRAAHTAQPRLHVFGHAHAAAGAETRGGTLFANVSMPSTDNASELCTAAVFEVGFAGAVLIEPNRKGSDLDA